MLRVDLTARKEPFRLASGQMVEGYTLNGSSPGPVITAEQGQLVEVRLVNESVPDGVTLHWHGVDVPNAVDGVAGRHAGRRARRGKHVYRFRADQRGSYWYHSHQVSHEQVQRGLLGALVVTPPGGLPGTTVDALALVHIYDGVRTVNGRPGETRVDAAPGTRVRVRVVNTDNGPMPVWVSGAAFRVVAVDGTDVREPGEVRDLSVEVTGGARADLEVEVPAGRRSAWSWVGRRCCSAGRPAALRAACGKLDLLAYGTPAALGFDPAAADRSFEYVIGRAPGFLDGWPGLWWTVNGHMYPDVPMYVVERGTSCACASRTAAASRIRCICTGTMRWSSPATGCPPPGAHGGSTRSTSGTASRTTSRSWPTTPASGWTTATTCPTLRKGWWRT